MGNIFTNRRKRIDIHFLPWMHYPNGNNQEIVDHIEHDMKNTIVCTMTEGDETFHGLAVYARNLTFTS